MTRFGMNVTLASGRAMVDLDRRRTGREEREESMARSMVNSMEELPRRGRGLSEVWRPTA